MCDSHILASSTVLSNSTSPRRADPLVVLSDLHFGEKDAALGTWRRGVLGPTERRKGTNHRSALGLLFDYLDSISPIDELILLGDTFEIWRFPWPRAKEHALEFFQRLADLRINRIVFTYGNHDHPALFEFERLDDGDVKQGDKSSSRHRDYREIFATFVRPLFPASIRDKAIVEYPLYFREIEGVAFTFHHGHYLKYLPFVSRITSIQRRRLSLQPDDMAEMESRWTLVFDGFRYLGINASRRERVHDIIAGTYCRVIKTTLPWIPKKFRDRIKPASWIPVDSKNMENYLDSVQSLLKIARRELGKPSRCDFFMFGHVHNAGVWYSSEPYMPTLVSLGCWLEERVPMAASRNVFAVIYPKRIEIRQVQEREVALTNSVNLVPEQKIGQHQEHESVK